MTRYLITKENIASGNTKRIFIEINLSYVKLFGWEIFK